MSGAFYSPDALEPGSDWRLLVTDRFVGAFAPATPVATMSTLWRVAADPAQGLDALVSAVPTRGAGAVDAFAIAAIGRGITFVVRGGGCADVAVGGRIRRIDARGAEPWYVAELNDVERFALGPLLRSPGDLVPAELDLPIEGGVVFGPWLGWSAELGSAPVPQRVRGPRVESGPVPTRSRAPESGPIPARAPRPESGPVPTRAQQQPQGRPAQQSGERVRERQRQAPSVPATPDFVPVPPAVAAAAAPPGEAPLLRPRPVRQAPPVPVEGLDPHDTNVLGDLGRRAASLHRHRGEPPATAPTPETEIAAAFRMGDRPAERVDAPVYVGRQPRSPRVTGPMLPRLVRVDSPSREVSATHIELRPTQQGLVLTDLESTNGTVVRQPGSGVRRLESGESLAVVPGTLIDIGDGNVIEILAYR